MERILSDYWQQGLQHQAIFALTADKIKDLWHVISSSECNSGSINNPEVLELLLARGTSMVVAPCYAKKHDQYFFPYLLLVDLSSDGTFKPNSKSALPIIPKTVVEPSVLSPISLGFLDNFESYFVMQPPIWQDDHGLLTWQQNLAYAQQMLHNVTNGVWQQHLRELGFVMQEGALMFAVADIYQPVNMDLKLLSSKSKIELIDAERNSGKSDYAKGLIIDAWMTAAIKKTKPPAYVWLDYEQQARYATIFDFASHDNLSCKTIDELHLELVDNYNAYLKGKQVMQHWQQIIDGLHNKYSDKGGIYARVAQLQDNLKTAHAHHRHLQVLHSIWLRQLELISSWMKIFDFVPFFQQQRLHRLYVFFKQNFPAEKVKGFKEEQLEEVIADKMRRAANSERFIADALHQTENDLRQETLVQEKCLQWVRTKDDKIVNLDSVKQLLVAEWDKLISCTLDYWHTDFALNNGYENFAIKSPDKIDLLIVEHAEYVSPMQAAELLAISQRAIIMGNYNPICNPRFSPHADYELTKSFDLVNCDADFEDLQFDGKLASLGNMWNLATQGRDADKVFASRAVAELQYEYKNIFAVSEAYLGSKLNLAEVAGIYNWLSSNISEIDQVAIYTVFSAQAQYLRDRLANTQFAKIPVRILQVPCFDPRAISLFSPVYTATDAGPYIFDRGVELLENLKANTTQKIVVLGDMSIFKPELHSASGKFAKLLNIKTRIQEVNCV